ncbi:MAG: hypothetical protein AAGA93_20475 [Actinomycetota bacterium]
MGDEVMGDEVIGGEASGERDVSPGRAPATVDDGGMVTGDRGGVEPGSADGDAVDGVAVDADICGVDVDERGPAGGVGESPAGGALGGSNV